MEPPLKTAQETRAFLRSLLSAFNQSCGASEAFASWRASYGPLGIETEYWMSLSESFTEIYESNSPIDLKPTDLLKACPWLESEKSRRVRAAEKYAPRGKKMPIPSPFERHN
jgi:hypothetical protein